jgi:cell division protein FtsA
VANNDPYLVAIDIGSFAIKLVVAKNSLDVQNKVQILALVQRSSGGIKRGVITNMSEATEAIVEIINQAEGIIGLPIRQVIVGISGTNINFKNSEGLVVISHNDNEITENDVDRVIQDSLSKAYNIHNSEILHTIPKSFVLDNQSGIKYPVGMIGHKMECKTLIISTENSYLRNFTKVFNQANLGILEQIYTPLAASEFLLSQRQKKVGTILVDIGSNSTTFIIWENEEIVGSGVIPLGGEHITADLAVGLQTTIEIAEKLKKDYLNVFSQTSEEIEVFNDDTGMNEFFETGDLVNYARPRVEEIFYYLSKELKKIPRTTQTPGGIVLIGGGASLNGILEISRNILKLPTFKHNFDKSLVEFVPDYNNEPNFMNAIALSAYLLYHAEEISQTQKFSQNSPTQNQNKSEKGGFLEFIKKFLPWG